MAAASVRNLINGTGTVNVTAGSQMLTFSGNQSFKEGATIVVDPSGTPQYFTIDSGAATMWTAIQKAAVTASGKAFLTSDHSASRNRGTNGAIVPDAAHFCYRGVIDNSANPDYYVYLDTLFPERGLHPYTRDQYLGITVSAAKAAQMLIPDLATRVRILEGLLRYNAGSGDGNILTPDARLRALETAVFGSPKTPSTQQALDLGDA